MQHFFLQLFRHWARSEAICQQFEDCFVAALLYALWVFMPCGYRNDGYVLIVVGGFE
jgi:hypothetical protein